MTKNKMAIIITAVLVLSACSGCSSKSSIAAISSSAPESYEAESSVVSVVTSKAESSIISQVSKLDSNVTSEDTSDLEKYEFDKNNYIMYSETKEKYFMSF